MHHFKKIWFLIQTCLFYIWLIRYYLLNYICSYNFLLFHIFFTKLFIPVYTHYLQTKKKCCTKSYLKHVIWHATFGYVQLQISIENHNLYLGAVLCGLPWSSLFLLFWLVYFQNLNTNGTLILLIWIWNCILKIFVLIIFFKIFAHFLCFHSLCYGINFWSRFWFNLPRNVSVISSLQ